MADGTTVTARRVALVGGGTMGGDLAVLCAARGWEVHLMSPSRATRDRLGNRITAGLAALGAPRERAASVSVYGALDELPWLGLDLVIESVTEDLALKRTVFADLERLAGPTTPLTSNTSTFPIREIAQALGSRSRVAGLHFFMPAHLVPLVEVVSADFTDEDVTARLLDLMRGLGKVPVHVRRDIPGFLANRLQHALMREALWLVAEGVVSPEDVDRAVRFGFGFRYLACGPMLQKELSGWDTHARAATSLYPHLNAETTPPPFVEEMVEAGRSGMKTGRGLWEWTEEEARKERARIEARLRAALEVLEGGGASRTSTAD